MIYEGIDQFCDFQQINIKIVMGGFCEIVIYDLDGDGFGDVVGVSIVGLVILWGFDGKDFEEFVVYFFEGIVGLGDFQVVDINCDGVLDIGVIVNDNVVFFLFGILLGSCGFFFGILFYICVFIGQFDCLGYGLE